MTLRLGRHRITREAIDAVAERVYRVQQRADKNGIWSKPWKDLNAREKFVFRDGVRMYLGPALAEGWRPPARKPRPRRRV